MEAIKLGYLISGTKKATVNFMTKYKFDSDGAVAPAKGIAVVINVAKLAGSLKKKEALIKSAFKPRLFY